MPHYTGEYSLEHALLWVFDPKREEPDFGDIDPSEISVFADEHAIAISAMHEVDGRVKVDLYVDENPDLQSTPVDLGEGQIDLLSGTVALAASPDWEISDEFNLPGGGGRYDVAIYGDSDAFSRRVVLHLTRGGRRTRIG